MAGDLALLDPSGDHPLAAVIDAVDAGRPAPATVVVLTEAGPDELHQASRALTLTAQWLDAEGLGGAG
ncbi:hypothetical protein ACFV9W_37800 [Streptomyces sp. NPDC059897]|uniref:hypothetical protein n=1 Tax=Streptomyces sp. NPDC059897 TaxID=3346994 RepID=UPI003646F53E